MCRVPKTICLVLVMALMMQLIAPRSYERIWPPAFLVLTWMTANSRTHFNAGGSEMWRYVAYQGAPYTMEKIGPGQEVSYLQTKGPYLHRPLTFAPSPTAATGPRNEMRRVKGRRIVMRRDSGTLRRGSSTRVA